MSLILRYERGKRYRQIASGEWIEHPQTEHEVAAAAVRIREMVETGRTPAIGGTNHSFMQGYDNNQQLDELDVHTRKKYIDAARRAKVSIHGKRYCTGLASEPCDPFAWVADGHEFKAKCRHKGYTAHGAIKVR